MIIRIFSRLVFSFQLNLNNTDEETVIMRTPITIISINKIIKFSNQKENLQIHQLKKPREKI